MAKKIFSWCVNLLCAGAILLSLLAGWTAVTTPKGRAPSLFGCTMLTVLTGSMEPTLPEQSLILVRETDPGDVRAGDIITFYASIAGYDGVINTHRVVEVAGEPGALSFRTKGDANAVEDGDPVPESRLIGRVFFHSYPLGVVVSFLRRPYVFLLCILAPLCLVILRSILQLVRLGREEVRRAEEELKEELHGPEER